MSSTSSLVNALQNSAQSFASDVNEQTHKVHTALNKIDNTVNNVNKQISELREMIIEGEEKQLAHENVLRIEQQIAEQLKSFQAVRRSVIGVIKDFDINLARGSTIQQLSEELWMSSSRYWLSYAFIAISAWVQNNKDVCANAVSEAMRRDASKTALFFCLLNLRFGRHIESREWLYEYFGAVDSVHPPRETALLLQAYLYGVFGKDAQLDSFVQTTVEKWMTQLNSDPDISTALTGDFTGFVKTLPSAKPSFKSDVLDEHCETVGEINASLVEAGRYATAVKQIEKLENVPEYNCDGNFIASVDKLLDDLVTNYDEEELRLRKEQEFYKMIMENEGNVEAAKKQYDAYLETVKDAPNIGKQMFVWTTRPAGVDETVQKFALQKTKGWYMNAVNEFDHDLKTSAPASFKLNIEFWSETTDGKDRESVKKSLDDKYKEERNKLLIFTKPNIIMSIVAIVALIIGCAVGIAAATWIGYVAGAGLFVVLALITVVTTAVKVKKYPERVKRAEETLAACLDEIDRYRAEFEKNCAVKDEVIHKLEFI